MRRSAAGHGRNFRRRVESDEIRIEPLNSIVLRKAVQYLERCRPDVRLRTLDAIHLATADLCQDFPLATTDARLADAAQIDENRNVSADRKIYN